MKSYKQIVVLVASIYFAFGCAKSASQSQAVNGQAVVPPVIVDPGSNSSPYFGSGSTVDFQPASLSVMNEYVATHPLNNPSQFKINVNLSQVQGGRYGGSVSISYMDNGLTYNGVFKAGLGTNQSFKGMYDNGKLESEYNYWFQSSQGLAFTGFFEDQYGAITITLVPDGTNPASGNDAEPILTNKYKGYVYFKNFGTTPAPHSPYRSCWFTYYGPYDCRSNVIQTKCGLFPGAEAGYKLLGTFNNIEIKKGFNIQ